MKRMVMMVLCRRVRRHADAQRKPVGSGRLIVMSRRRGLMMMAVKTRLFEVRVHFVEITRTTESKSISNYSSESAALR